MIICSYCEKAKATWMLMSGDLDACDDCLPRKCSCNIEPIDGDWESSDDDNWVYRMDENGKHLPCCEWEKITIE